MDIGEVFTYAVLEAFDQPAFQGYSQPQPVMPMGGGGPVTMPPQPVYGPSPLAAAANHIYAEHRAAIHAALAEHIDLDALATSVAARVKADLTEGGNYGRLSPLAENIRARVTEMLAREVADDTRTAYETEQRRMREAYDREQRRERAAAAIEAAERDREHEEPVQGNDAENA